MKILPARIGAFGIYLILVLTAQSSTMLVSEYGTGNILGFDLDTGNEITLPSHYTPVGGNSSGADGMVQDDQGRLYVNQGDGTISRRSLDGDFFSVFADLEVLYLLDLDRNDTHLFAAQYGANTLFQIALSDAAITSIAGPAGSVRFDGVRIGPDGRVYVVDSSNGGIYAYDLTTSTWSTFLAPDNAGDASQLEFGLDGRVFLSRTISGQARIYSYTLNTPGNYALGLDASSQTLIGAYGSSGAATGIRIGSDGRLYANAFNAGEVWRSNVGITAMESFAFITGLNEPGSIFFEAEEEQFTAQGTPYEWLRQFFDGREAEFEELDLQDVDGDGHPTWREYIADTDPTDDSDHFPPVELQRDGESLLFEISRTSAARVYRLHSTPSLIDPDWVVLTNTFGTGDKLIWEQTFESGVTTSLYFRTSVTLP